MLEKYHAYILNFVALAAGGGNSQAAFQVETALRFEIRWLTAFVYDANGLGIAESVLPRLGVILQEGTTSQPLTSSGSTGGGTEAPLRTLFGTGERPFPMPVKHVVHGGGTFLAQVFNRHIANIYSVVLAFHGILLPENAPARRAIPSPSRLRQS